MKKTIALGAFALVVAVAATAQAQAQHVALAALSFNKLTADTFTVSHSVKLFGGRGVAMEVVYEKAASLCIAAGYSHFEILDQESNAGSEHQPANASIRVRFSQKTGPERIDCQEKSDPKYVDQAKRKLEKQGYQGPAAESELVSEEAASEAGSCTIEQITAMAKAGLSDEQIEAACAGTE